MRYCACSHPDSVHAGEGVGACMGSKRNGDACDCEGFRSATSQDAGAAAPTLRLSVEDCLDINYQVKYLVKAFREKHTLLPETVVLRGRGQELRFDLVYHDGQWVYEYVGEIYQLSGKPGKWRIPA